MKKLISFLAFSFCALTVNAQATHNMKITFQDGNTVVYGMENVKTVEFVEKEEPSAKETYTINGVEYPMPEAVDLGLPSGTKWASMNIGAKDSYDVGGYYGWADPTGELTAYSYYWRNEMLDGAWDSVLFGGVNPPRNISGTELDLATQKMGKGWVMPSSDDFKELADNCTFILFDEYIKLTGPNKNTVILPNSGIGCFSGAALYSYVLEMTDVPCFWASTRSLYNESEPEGSNYFANMNYPSADYAHADTNFCGMSGPCDSWYRNGMIPIRPIQKGK